MSRPRTRIEPLAAAVAVAAYLNGLHGDWLDDDPLAIVDNPDVQGTRSLRELWSNDFWGTPMADPTSHLSFRPLTILSFRAQRALVGLHGPSFHMVNVLLHALATIGFARCCRPLVRRRSQRAAAALLFAVHAVHVESVTNTVGRAESLSAVAFFASLLCYQPLLRRSPARGRPAMAALRLALRVGGTVCLAGAGMLCKEVSITALLVCAALDWLAALRRRAAPRPARAWVCFGARQLLLGGGAAALLLLRLRLNGWRSPTFSGADNSAAFCPTLRCRALSYSYLYYLNLRLLLLPDNLAHDWSMSTVPNLHDLSDPRLPYALLPYALLAAAALVALAALRRSGTDGAGGARGAGGATSGATSATGTVVGAASRRGGDVGPGAALALLLLPFLPSCHVLVTVGFTVAERVLYLPSTGFCLGLSLALPPRPSGGGSGDEGGDEGGGGGGGQWRRRRRAVAAALWCGLLCMHAVLVLRRNNDWRTNLSLLRSGVQHQPTNCKLRYNLAHALSRDGGGVAAAAAAARPHGAAPHLEGVHVHVHAHDEALHHLSAAVRLLPTFTEASCLQACQWHVHGMCMAWGGMCVHPGPGPSPSPQPALPPAPAPSPTPPTPSRAPSYATSLASQSRRPRCVPRSATLSGQPTRACTTHTAGWGPPCAPRRARRRCWPMHTPCTCHARARRCAHTVHMRWMHIRCRRYWPTARH